jgi:predicted RNA-binding Zn-ribbon protein involved in translation (DUF1610 family)
MRLAYIYGFYTAIKLKVTRRARVTLYSSTTAQYPQEGSSTLPCPQKRLNLITSMSPTTRTWHARRSPRFSELAVVCGGNLSRPRSRSEQSAGKTSPLTDTAHVPHVPSPRQLISFACPLCGDKSARSKAVRSRVPLSTTTSLPRKCTIYFRASSFERGDALPRMRAVADRVPALLSSGTRIASGRKRRDSS